MWPERAKVISDHPHNAEIRSFDGAARVIGGASATFARRWCARAGQREGKRTGRRRLKPASGSAAVAVVELVSFGSAESPRESRDSPCDVRPQSQLLRPVQ